MNRVLIAVGIPAENVIMPMSDFDEDIQNRAAVNNNFSIYENDVAKTGLLYGLIVDTLPDGTMKSFEKYLSEADEEKIDKMTVEMIDNLKKLQCHFEESLVRLYIINQIIS